MSQIDQDAYLIENKSLGAYYEEIKVLKNKKIIEKLEVHFHITRRVIASDDLGIDEKTWINAGYDRFKGEYYYNDPKPADKDTLSKSSNCIPFASFNVTRRRNFFCGISDMGFPHFESVDALKDFIDHFGCSEVRKSYQDAVKSYKRR